VTTITLNVIKCVRIYSTRSYLSLGVIIQYE